MASRRRSQGSTCTRRPARSWNGKGFATCAPSVIQEKGPSACSKKSTAGPKGSASGVVSFGTERVQETVSVQPFFAPGGGLEFFVDGVSPVSIEILSKGSITGAAPPFGQEFIPAKCR